MEESTNTAGRSRLCSSVGERSVTSHGPVVQTIDMLCSTQLNRQASPVRAKACLMQMVDQFVVVLSHFSLAEKYSMNLLSLTFVDLMCPIGSKFDTKWAASA
jgi:hypothetical protein